MNVPTISHKFYKTIYHIIEIQPPLCKTCNKMIINPKFCKQKNCPIIPKHPLIYNRPPQHKHLP